MRPRHKAAENVCYERTMLGGVFASMRPRHKAAENRRAASFRDGALRVLQ